MDRIILANKEDQNWALEELRGLFEGNLNKLLLVWFNQQGDIFIEELLNAVWRKVSQKAIQCRGNSETSIFNWILKIARNTGLNMIRDNKKYEEILSLDELVSKEDNPQVADEQIGSGQSLWNSQDPSPRTIEDQIILDEQFRGWSNKLTKQEQKVFDLILDGYLKIDIADTLGISRPRVTQIIKQIELKIKQSLI